MDFAGRASRRFLLFVFYIFVNSCSCSQPFKQFTSQPPSGQGRLARPGSSTFLHTYIITIIIIINMCVYIYIYIHIMYVCVYIYIYIYIYIYLRSVGFMPKKGIHAETSDVDNRLRAFLTACRKESVVLLPLAARKPNLVSLTAYRPLPFLYHRFTPGLC